MKKPKREIPELLEYRRRRVLLHRDWISLLARILLAAAAAWLLLDRVFLLTQVRGNSMFPALEDGDLLLGYRLIQQFSKNDTVLYNADGRRMVGRIVAGEDDLVSFDDSGTLRVNGSVQDEHAFFLSEGKDCLDYPYRIEPGQVFILGDYRTCSTDSRDFGPIPVSRLEAKVITVLRRRRI